MPLSKPFQNSQIVSVGTNFKRLFCVTDKLTWDQQRYYSLKRLNQLLHLTWKVNRDYNMLKTDHNLIYILLLVVIVLS